MKNFVVGNCDWSGLVVVTMISVSCVNLVEAATIKAESVSFRDVSWAVNSARNGDIVAVPAGTADWTETLITPKAVTVQGAGPDQTVITDNVAVNNGNVFRFTTRGGNVRVTGIKFQIGSPTRTVYSQGTIQVYKADTVRIDHCAFYHLRNRALYLQTERGVIDHNTFTFLSGGGLQVEPHLWGGGDNYGDTSWSSPLNLGGDHAIFIEDNTFNNDGHVADNTIAVDGTSGCRYVFRHNTCYDIEVGCHGSGTGGRFRGGRSFEIYQNTFTNTHLDRWPQPIGLFRSGTGVIWGNTVCKSPGNSYKYFAQLGCDRDMGYFAPWGGADGRSEWDLNDTNDQTGNKYGGGKGGLYATGKHTGTNGSLTLVVSVGSPGNTSPAWSTNQWRGYAIRNITKNRFANCVGNTQDTITLGGSYHTTGATFPWNTGDEFEIRKVIQHFDGIGSSTGDLLKDASPNPHPIWLHQTIEPLYLWSNTFNGSSSLAVPTVAHGFNIIEGKDYINNGDTPKPGYKPYIYPHPLVSGKYTRDETPNARSGARAD